nr:hypothetical protein [Kibdelosporangium sp. MJ126-NF4]CEL15003.1 hypothetical protein [Kibdelosporangium sp. MJ126-NF4]CTQ93401.1 hypothetical protein [Kibdelosporangium sp. MJ126-NF4]
MKMRISGGDIDAPSVVRVSFWSWIAAAAMGLIYSVLFFVAKNGLIEETIKARPDLNADQIRSGASAFIWLTLILAVLFGSLYVYFAYKMLAGERKQRVRLLIAGVLHLVVSLLFPVNLIVLIGVVLSVVGALTMYLPAPAKAYFTTEV